MPSPRRIENYTRGHLHNSRVESKYRKGHGLSRGGEEGGAKGSVDRCVHPNKARKVSELINPSPERRLGATPARFPPPSITLAGKFESCPWSQPAEGGWREEPRLAPGRGTSRPGALTPDLRPLAGVRSPVPAAPRNLLS